MVWNFKQGSRTEQNPKCPVSKIEQNKLPGRKCLFDGIKKLKSKFIFGMYNHWKYLQP